MKPVQHLIPPLWQFFVAVFAYYLMLTFLEKMGLIKSGKSK